MTTPAKHPEIPNPWKNHPLGYPESKGILHDPITPAATGKITGHQDYPTNGKLPNSEE